MWVDHFTELLNRESRAAHQSLIEPTPKSTHHTIQTYSSSQQRTSISPTASRLKTKRSKTSIEKPKAKKPLKTYGKSSQDIFEFHGGSDGELGNTPRIDFGHNAEQRKSNEKRKIDRASSRRGSQDEGVARKLITSSGGDTELLSTDPKINELLSTAEKDGFVQSSMPPPASKSTSSDQPQRSQTDKIPTSANPAPLGPATTNLLPSATAIYHESQSDDTMSAPMRPSRGKYDEKRPQDLAQSVHLQSMCSDEATRRVDLHLTGSQASSLGALEVIPNKTIATEGTKRSTNVSEEFDLHLESSHLDSPLDPQMSTTINPVVLLPALTDTESAQDELSLSIPEAASKTVTKSTKASKRKRDVDDEPLDELGSDDNALGLPKEHYQPRPSKRRSGGGDGEIVVPADFSKRPEAIGKRKRKTKRHKTTAFQELLPKDEDADEDEEIKVVPDPRFEIPEKKTPKTSTESDQPDVERIDNTEEIQPEALPEPNQAVKSTSQKKRGRPKKVVTTISEEIVLHEVDTDHDQEGVEIEEHVISATAKKSRQRSKTKETATPLTDGQDNNNNNNVGPAAQDDSEAPPASTNILNDITGNINLPNPMTNSSPSMSPIKHNAPPQTPHKSTSLALKGPDKHSPISIGKVSYRVGLSKRARIAPLLRIVRK